MAERAVQERDGAGYSLSNYREGDDYVIRKCFSSQKRMFRADILGLSVVNPSLVEHKQQPEPVMIQDEQPLIMIAPSRLDDSVKMCKVAKKYPNSRVIDTDTQGRVIVGKIGVQLKVGHVIKVKNGVIYTGK